jgi:hypothetical protein
MYKNDHFQSLGTKNETHVQFRNKNNILAHILTMFILVSLESDVTLN